MKLLFTLTFITMLFSLSAQSSHIAQSSPFENVLLSLKSDSVDLFMNAFSKRIVNGEYNKETWIPRLNEGKGKFSEYFGTFQLSDFSYEFDEKESKLIIFFRREEKFRMSVIKENEVWKLDER